MCFLILSGAKNAVMPKINPILAILLPSMFPRAIPGFSCAATIDVAISGIEVAIDTTVRPTIIGSILILTEIEDAPFVSISPP